MRAKSILSAAMDIAAVLLVGIAASRGGEKRGNKLAPAEAKAIAQDAYVFGLPPVYFALNQDVMTNVAKPEGGRAPLNQFAHFREFPDPSNRTVVIWNVDTLYSIGTLDLTAEPLVLSIPEMGDRWWLMQVLDAWNDVPAAPGTRTVGSKGGNFALVGPSWKGKLPEGLREVRIDTSLCALGGRTYTAGKADYKAVHKIQDKYTLTPLSKWGTDYLPPANLPIKPGVDAKTPIGTQVFKMSAEQFFNRVCDLLVNNPARDADAEMMTRIAKLGIRPGAKFQLDAFDADMRKAIQDGVAAGQKAILDHESKMGKRVNGWVIALDGGRYGTNYLNRAAWTYFAIGTNLAEDAVYPHVVNDSVGKPLTGGNKYVLRFAKEQIPPAANFWSLTLYDNDGYLVATPINRHAIGDRSNLTIGKDGSLTIYIQAESPGKDRESNWLPCPKSGQFKLYLRLYGPRQEVMDGTWRPAAVENKRSAR
jgi:hypothetical protein